MFLNQFGEAFDDDRDVLEAQQRAILEHGDSWTYALQADAGSVQARRVLARMIAAEAPHSTESAPERVPALAGAD